MVTRLAGSARQAFLSFGDRLKHAWNKKSTLIPFASDSGFGHKAPQKQKKATQKLCVEKATQELLQPLQPSNIAHISMHS